ncbi:MAG: lipocalin family protein [Myxococcales bacterium]|nr:lipocalin family protein [Myxococcales bacterium]
MMDTFCVGPGNPSAPTCSIDVQVLGRWQHDASASQGSELTFVPADRELGPARFRRTLVLRDATEEGPATVTTNVLAPNDAHYEVEGTWSVSGQTLTLTYRLRDATEDTVEVFEVVEANGSTLRLLPR